jgi:hypothetical protein
VTKKHGLWLIGGLLALLVIGLVQEPAWAGSLDEAIAAAPRGTEQGQIDPGQPVGLIAGAPPGRCAGERRDLPSVRCTIAAPHGLTLPLSFLPYELVSARISSSGHLSATPRVFICAPPGLRDAASGRTDQPRELIFIKKTGVHVMLHKKMTQALNEQINREMYSAYLYMAMSAHSANVGLKGFANWFMVQYHEEMFHAMKLYEYVQRQGEDVVFRP